MINYALVLRHGWNKKWKSINGNDPDQIVMKEGEKKPSKKQLKDYWEKYGDEIHKDQRRREANILRRNAYRNEADPLYLKWQRGEATEQDWLDKIAEIKERFPKPE